MSKELPCDLANFDLDVGITPVSRALRTAMKLIRLTRGSDAAFLTVMRLPGCLLALLLGLVASQKPNRHVFAPLKECSFFLQAIALTLGLHPFCPVWSSPCSVFPRGAIPV